MREPPHRSGTARPRSARPLVFLYLVLVVGTLFVPLWLSGNLYAHFDLQSLTIPLEDLFARYQRAGTIPLWAPEVQGGYPVHANGLHSFWYPPHLLLRSILPGPWVANVSLALHLLLAAWGMWLFLRAERCAPAAAAGGGVLFACSGFFVGRLGLSPLVLAAAWVPLVLLFFTAWWDRGRAAALAGAALAVAASFLAGHVQMAGYGLGAVLLFSIVRAASTIRQSPRTAAQRLFLLVVALALGALLAAVYLLPLAEVWQQSVRGSPLQTAEERFDVSYPPAHLLTWIFPFAFGHLDTYFGGKNEFELASFVGVTGTVLGLLALTLRPTYRSVLGRTAIALVAVGFLLASGGASPLYRLLVERGPLQHLANPARFVVLVHLGWTLLAAAALSTLPSLSRRARGVRLSIALLILIMVGAILLFGVLPPDTRARVTTELVRHPTTVGVPVLLSGIVLTLLALPKTVRGTHVVGIVGLITVELLAVGIRWNPALATSLALKPPTVLSSFPSERPMPRFFAHEQLFAGPRPDFGPAVGMVITSEKYLRQEFATSRQALNGMDVRLTWNGKPPTDGELRLTVFENQTPVRHSRLDAARVGQTGEWSTFAFDPLPIAPSTRYAITLTSSLPSSPRAVRAYLYANHGDDDGVRGGRLETCREAQCQPVTIEDSRAGPDLALRPRAPAQPINLSRELLSPLEGESLGVESARGHLALQFTRVFAYLRELGEHRRGVGSANNPLLATHRDLLDRFGIGYLLASYEEAEHLTGLPDIREVATVPLGERVGRLYRNDQAYPRVHLAQRVYAMGPEPDPILQTLRDGLPPTAVVAEDLPFTGARDFDTSGSSVTLATYAPTGLRVHVSAANEVFLVVRDVLTTGWVATMDGTSTALYPTDYVFRGVIVPPGDHEIAMRYQPRSFRLGAALSALGVLGTLLLLVPGAVRWHARRQPPMLRPNA